MKRKQEEFAVKRENSKRQLKSDVNRISVAIILNSLIMIAVVIIGMAVRLIVAVLQSNSPDMMIAFDVSQQIKFIYYRSVRMLTPVISDTSFTVFMVLLPPFGFILNHDAAGESIPKIINTFLFYPHNSLE